jgi:hypothetical protein
MKVRITQIDGALPNLALMKLSHWHKARGDEVYFSRNVRPDDVAETRGLLEPPHYDRVYGSAIFNFSQIRLMRFQREFPGAIVGGTGTPSVGTVEDVIGEEYEHYDYSLYPEVSFSIGFTMRGCRNKCGFCVVPKKEGGPRSVSTIAQIWRGEPHPRHLHLLDNDFFGNPEWPARIKEMQDGKFKVALTQGINVRNLTDEQAAAIATINYRDGHNFKDKRIYTAWDNPKEGDKLMRGLELLKKHGVKPDHLMVYMLIGFWPNETAEHWRMRQGALREFGARPYPMPFVRTKETVGFQRWVVGAYDKRIPWADWKAANYEPRNLPVAA